MISYRQSSLDKIYNSHWISSLNMLNLHRNEKTNKQTNKTKKTCYLKGGMIRWKEQILSLGSVQKYFGGRGLSSCKILASNLFDSLNKPQNFLSLSSDVAKPFELPLTSQKTFDPPCEIKKSFSFLGHNILGVISKQRFFNSALLRGSTLNCISLRALCISETGSCNLVNTFRCKLNKGHENKMSVL